MRRGDSDPGTPIAQWGTLYYRFTLSFRDVEDLLAQRGITVSYESIRHWCEIFGAAYARRLRRWAAPVGDTWHLDELFVTIRGQRQYLWRAVDQDGEVIDVLLQPRSPEFFTARGAKWGCGGNGVPLSLIS